MDIRLNFSFIVCASDKAMVDSRLVPSLELIDGDELIVMEDYKNLASAYADGEEEAKNTLLCFVHQDVEMPKGWRGAFLAQLMEVLARDPSWAVIGLFGEYIDNNELKMAGNVLQDNGICRAGDLPQFVAIVDGFFVVKRKGDFKFDPNVPHFQGAAISDICYQAIAARRKSWVVNVDGVKHYCGTHTYAPEETTKDGIYLMSKWGSPIITNNVVFWFGDKDTGDKAFLVG